MASDPAQVVPLKASPAHELDRAPVHQIAGLAPKARLRAGTDEVHGRVAVNCRDVASYRCPGLQDQSTTS